MEFFQRQLRAWVDPADVFVTLYSTDANAFWLDRENNPLNHFSVMGHAAEAAEIGAAQLFETVGVMGQDSGEQHLPFTWQPGFVGWFDYWANPLDPETLTGSWLPVNEAIVFDHSARAVWFAGRFKDAEHFEEWVRGALLRLSLSGGRKSGYLLKHRDAAPAIGVEMAHSPEQYLGLVGRAREAIAAGDVYQLCLTNRLTLECSQEPLAVFLRLREQSPSPYSAYVKISGKTLVCSSPEQFLGLTEGGIATTRPIKGTRPRAGDPDTDAEIAAELAGNLKERAENLMIVDLMRNDLARVSVPETVAVTGLFEVEPYATVHQLVSTVTSQIRSDVTLGQLIEAVFPGGSMTGAPKVRACQLIAEFEGVQRGLYSGAVGWIGEDGGNLFGLDLAMVIRSLVFEGETVTIGVGGGITIDSDPTAELAETELKAKALLQVIGAANPWQTA